MGANSLNGAQYGSTMANSHNMTPSKMGKVGQIMSPQGALTSLQGLNSINLNAGIVQNSKTPKEQYKRMGSLPG